MSIRFKTVFNGFNFSAKDLNDNNLGTINCYGLHENFYEYIKKFDTPCQVTASYTLDFVDTYFQDQPVVHSVERKMNFWVVPTRMDTSKENVSLIKKYLKSKKMPSKNVLIINKDGHTVAPRVQPGLPKAFYGFFVLSHDQESR